MADGRGGARAKAGNQLVYDIPPGGNTCVLEMSRLFNN